ncbi:MAG: aminotransferase class I/II-fold pyridoxal phosphate-dependent enzyme, partial [Acidobacteriota bacterium]
MTTLDDHNHRLEAGAPALFRLLSPLGRAAYFPPDIPFQAREAKDTSFNGTIGVFTDGHGHAVPLPSMASAFDLDAAELDAAFLYSPVLGFPEVRDAWQSWQRGEQGDTSPSADAETSRPAVVAGLTHGLSLIADLFGGPDRRLVVALPFWGNYRQVFTLRTGAELVTPPAYRDGRYDPSAVPSALAELPNGEPALALVNFPSNPGGYSPTVDERTVLRDGLIRAAEDRPLMVICDEAYSGLVFEDGVPNRSFFWDLVGAHEQLVPVKIDGATKEFAFFGGRTAFVTFGVDLDEGAAAAIENKMQCLSRGTIGSPSATAQRVLLRALRSDKTHDEVDAIRQVARERYDAIQPALASLDRSLLRPLPFNAGFFLLMELAPDL